MRRFYCSVCVGQSGSAVVETSPKSRHVVIAVQAGLAAPCQLARMRPLPLGGPIGIKGGGLNRLISTACILILLQVLIILGLPKALGI